MELVGSRKKGTATPKSDWDIMLDKIAIIGTSCIDVGFPLIPNWDEARELVDLDAIREQAKKRYNIPTSSKIDIFCGAWCPQKQYFGIMICRNDGGHYMVAVEDTWEETLDIAKHGYPY